jgi:hypothetical protein
VRLAARRLGTLASVSRRRLAALCALVALLSGLALPVGALADGDPASDVLIGQNVYSPYQPRLAPNLMRALDDLTKATAKAGFPVKVALIASPNDLGVVPNLFGKPQEYANFLGPEIQYNKVQPVLVVMPAGFGTFKGPPSAPTALKGLVVAGPGPDDLARAAIPAVVKLSAAAGHPVPTPKIPGAARKSGGGGGGSALIFAAPILLLVLGGAFFATRRATAGAGEGLDDLPTDDPPAVESPTDAGP